MTKQAVTVDVSNVLHLTMPEAAKALGVTRGQLHWAMRSQRPHEEWPGRTLRRLGKKKYSMSGLEQKRQQEIEKFKQPFYLTLLINKN